MVTGLSAELLQPSQNANEKPQPLMQQVLKNCHYDDADDDADDDDGDGDDDDAKQKHHHIMQDDFPLLKHHRGCQLKSEAFQNSPRLEVL